MTKINGINASPGIAIAKVLLITTESPVISDEKITKDMLQNELEKFEISKEKTITQLKALYEKTKKNLGEKEAQIFDAHLEMINDPMLEESVKLKLTEESKNLVLALEETKNEIATIFEMMDDEYMKERASDVKDVASRMINNVLGVNLNPFENLDKEVIVISKDLTPSDTASMDFKYVKGFATDVGGKTGHSSIMARTLEIAAVVGTKNITTSCKTDDTIIVDGSEGVIIINPDEETIKHYTKKQKDYLTEKESLFANISLESITTDGKTVELASNIGKPSDVANALKYGAEGIGLFRTEFLYMESKSFPSEEIQFNAYKEAVVNLKGKPLIIRTLDIGGDKELSYFDFGNEMNPFLGYRAIRICLADIDIFKTQLRAILRASSFGKIRIMFPMIISVDEILKAKQVIYDCMEELKNENIPFDQNISIGIMCETPASAVMAQDLIKHVDFFSIGTNDLTQYILAVDRGNEKISYLYDTYNPAVLRSIKNIIDASHSQEGKFTGMCGEFAGDPKATLLLLGMGLDEFSMGASSIPYIKKIIRESSYESAKIIADEVLKLSTTKEVHEYLDNLK